MSSFYAIPSIVPVGGEVAGWIDLVARTTDDTPTQMTTDGSAAALLNTLNLTNFSTYTGLLIVVGKTIGSTDTACWLRFCGAVRGASAADTTIMGGTSGADPTFSTVDPGIWNLDIAADTTYGGISVLVTGAAATTIEWSSRFTFTSVRTAS